VLASPGWQNGLHGRHNKMGAMQMRWLKYIPFGFSIARYLAKQAGIPNSAKPKPAERKKAAEDARVTISEIR